MQIQGGKWWQDFDHVCCVESGGEGGTRKQVQITHRDGSDSLEVGRNAKNLPSG